MNSTEPANAVPGPGNPVTIADLWATMWSRRRLVAAVAGVVTLLALALALYLPPVFRAETLLAPSLERGAGGRLASISGQFGGLASMAGINLGGASREGEEAFAVLTSRAITTQFIERNELLPVLFSDSWDASRKQWISDEPKTAWDGFERFKEIRNAVQDNKSGLVTLTIEWGDPVQAAQWANGLVRLTNEALRDRQIERSTRNLEYLRQQLEVTNVLEVRQAIYRLLETEIKSIMLAQGDSEFAYKVLDPAVVPEEKAKPQRTLIAVGGMLVGGVIAVLLALMLGPRSASPDRAGR